MAAVCHTVSQKCEIPTVGMVQSGNARHQASLVEIGQIVVEILQFNSTKGLPAWIFLMASEAQRADMHQYAKFHANGQAITDI